MAAVSSLMQGNPGPSSLWLENRLRQIMVKFMLKGMENTSEKSKEHANSLLLWIITKLP